jgi:hypothetical protein
MLGHVRSGYARLGHVRKGYVRLVQAVTLGQVN